MCINQSVSAVKSNSIEGGRGSSSTTGKQYFSFTFDVSIRNAKRSELIWPQSEHNTDPGRGRWILIQAAAEI